MLQIIHRATFSAHRNMLAFDSHTKRQNRLPHLHTFPACCCSLARLTGTDASLPGEAGKAEQTRAAGSSYSAGPYGESSSRDVSGE